MSAANVVRGKSGRNSISAGDAKEKPVKKSGKIRRGTIPRQVKSHSETSILEGKFNLGCNAGHRWFSPTPDEWLGHKCYYPSGKKECPFPIHRLNSKGEIC